MNKKIEMPIIHHDLFTILKFLLISGLVCLVTGIVAVSIDWKNLGALLLLTSVLIFLGLYFLNEKYKKYKIIYQENLSNDRVAEILNHGSYEFTNEHLIYRSKKICQKINWSEFISYKLINSKHIVLLRRSKTEQNLIISETEMDKSDFKKVIEFINENVKKNYLQHRV